MKENKEVQPLVYTIAETATLLGICKTAAYEAVKEGTIPILKLGRRKVVPKIALQKLLEKASMVK